MFLPFKFEILNVHLSTLHITFIILHFGL